jgi:colicin import membrane protein
MENRSLSVAPFLSLLLLLAGPVSAAGEASPEQTAQWDRRLEAAGELRRAGDAREAAADALYEQEAAACLSKILSNDCRNAAHSRRVAERDEARKMVNEGKAVEREVKKEQLADRDARLAADAPKRADDLETRAAETLRLRQESAASQAEMRARKAQQAEEGARQRAADAERISKKRADHEAKLAEKKARAERRANKAPEAKP